MCQGRSRGACKDSLTVAVDLAGEHPAGELTVQDPTTDRVDRQGPPNDEVAQRIVSDDVLELVVELPVVPLDEEPRGLATTSDGSLWVDRMYEVARYSPDGALVARIEAALTAAAPPPGARPIPTLVWQSGGMVPGQDTMISQLLARTGFANAAGAMGLKQADLLPLERVLAAPPQLILTAGNLHGNEDRMLRHPALAGLAGTARARLDPSLLWCGGPTIIRAAERLAQVRRTMAQ